MNNRNATRSLTVVAKLRLVAAVIAIVVIWLVILPRIGETPSVRARIDANEARNINPDAMFYTELEAMPGIEDAIARKRQ